MSRLASTAAVAVCACNFAGPSSTNPGNEDASVDGAECTVWDFEPAHFDPCALPGPSPALALGAGTWTYETGLGVLIDPQGDTAASPANALVEQSDGSTARLIAVESLDVGGDLRVVGSFPLIVASTDSIEVSGSLEIGAGIDGDGCGAALPGTDDPGEGGGGGGGGGFGGLGGSGGDGSAGAGPGGSSGGVAALPAVVRGGCSGARGAGIGGGSGGRGGGALQLTANSTITITGEVIASGAGGDGAAGGRSGGGGGGSGGYLGLQAGVVAIGPGASIAANGGGGGGGCDNGVGDPGENGRGDDQPAAGGIKEGGGGNGGDGGAGSSPNGAPGDPAGRGGGGGGGAAGYVVLFESTGRVVVDGGAVVSPDPSDG